MSWLNRLFHPDTPQPQPPATLPTPVLPPVPTAPGGATQATITHRTLLIHGYSASGKEFEAWKTALCGAKDADGKSLIDVETVEIGNYLSLNNEITIKDLGEAFDRALRFTTWSDQSKDDMFTFDAIVHSTGMLVLRQWLTSDPFLRTDDRSRIKRLKHLIGLAPATFGSPQGKQGRSWLGALVKGNKGFGPDFLNAGNKVLDGLELGSKYTWDLAMKDMVAETPMYDGSDQTPYVAVFIGNQPYDGLANLASAPGTDGTVRWAGCALNTRLVRLDFQRQPKLQGSDGTPTRALISKWADDRLPCPMLAVEGRNHGTILSDPEADTVSRVSDFLLTVNSQDKYAAWLKDAQAHSAGPRKTMDDKSQTNVSGHDYGGAGWQQFVFHVIDDHGDAVNDYNVQLFMGDDLAESDTGVSLPQPLLADTYSGDSSYRCYYLRLSDELKNVGNAGSTKKVWMELIASSGTSYLEYEAYFNVGDALPQDNVAKLSTRNIDQPIPNLVKLELTNVGNNGSLFFPYTTTLVEIVLEREPSLMPDKLVSELFLFWQGNQTANP